MYGEVGKDGNGIEYIYTLTETDDVPSKPASISNKSENDLAFPITVVKQDWWDDPQSVSKTYQYC